MDEYADDRTIPWYFTFVLFLFWNRVDLLWDLYGRLFISLAKKPSGELKKKRKAKRKKLKLNKQQKQKNKKMQLYEMICKQTMRL